MNNKICPYTKQLCSAVGCSENICSIQEVAKHPDGQPGMGSNIAASKENEGKQADVLIEKIKKRSVAYATAMMGIGEYSEKWNYADKMMWSNIERSYREGAIWSKQESGERGEVERLKGVLLECKKYFGENDKTVTQHRMYDIIDKVLRNDNNI